MIKLSDDVLGRERLIKDIVGEVVLSDNLNSVLKKWRNIFKISQKELAEELGITSSVISDYESGRRKSPGIKIIKRYIEALLSIDKKVGGEILKSFSKKTEQPLLSDAIIDMREFASGIDVNDFCKKINAKPIVNGSGVIYGYSVIDSLKAITEFSSTELINVYGSTTQRALIFTKLSTGRGPMVAIKLTNLKPALVVLHGIGEVDEIAKRIAEAEGIPLVITKDQKLEELIERINKIE
ncbi:MAG: helix-turn-helix domain-containing protein [Candidatus Aenigmarchaeota archaeon]|nr:helix-turn-helix domain-containing protein [Candidatus Aenigmarchaeota archaeon]